MEGHCSTGQSPQWAVVPMEEEGGGGGGGGGGEEGGGGGGEEKEEEEGEGEEKKKFLGGNKYHFMVSISLLKMWKVFLARKHESNFPL